MLQFNTDTSSLKKNKNAPVSPYQNKILTKISESRPVFLSLLIVLFSLISFLSFSLVSNKAEKASVEKDLYEFKDLVDKLDQKLNLLQIEVGKLTEQKHNRTNDLSVITSKNNDKLVQLSSLKNKYNKMTNTHLQNDLSEILSLDDIKLIEEWTGKKFLFPCFVSGGRLALSGKQFHPLCDLYNNTVTVLKTKGGSIMGGFTTKTWEGEVEKIDDKAFVFNLNDKRKFPVKPGRPAISCNYENLPVFGYDLSLSKDIYFSRFPSSYMAGENETRTNPLYNEGEGKTMIDMVALEVFVLN